METTSVLESAELLTSVLRFPDNATLATIAAYLPQLPSLPDVPNVTLQNVTDALPDSLQAAAAVVPRPCESTVYLVAAAAAVAATRVVFVLLYTARTVRMFGSKRKRS